MTQRIRKATLADLQLLEKMEIECFPEYQRSNRRVLSASITSPYQEVYIASVKQANRFTDAGSMVLHVHKKTLRIFSVATFPAFQNQGVGKFLIDFCFKSAQNRGFEKISLEASASNEHLIDWYAHFGFKKHSVLENYYAEGVHAVRMVYRLPSNKPKSYRQNIIVVDSLKASLPQLSNIEIVTARQYLSGEKYQNIKNARVFNLCGSYKYQSTGYYVSLLASARDHRAIPTVNTMSDFRNISLMKSISFEFDELIQKSFSKVIEKRVILKIYFGQTDNHDFKTLANRLYTILESPILQIVFVKAEKWYIHKASSINLEKLDQSELESFSNIMTTFFSKKRFLQKSPKTYKYDLAIMINPDEKNPPSNNRALLNFKKAAEKQGMFTEFITKSDINRLVEFDALFIRETTSVNNHTYQASRLAHAEGLVVIDDPWSILRCSNKIFLNERMVLNDINVPFSKVLSRSSFKQKDIAGMEYPMVLKQPDGAFSTGVRKVKNFEELQEQLRLMFKTSELVIVQEYMPSEYDWRIGVLDHQPLFACKYFMAKGHWQIYNWSNKVKDKEGLAQSLPVADVPENIISTALKAASLMGDGLYGVDLKEIDGKVYVIEVNDNPNIDVGVEDRVLKHELYDKIINSLIYRIEISRNFSYFQ